MIYIPVSLNATYTPSDLNWGKAEALRFARQSLRSFMPAELASFGTYAACYTIWLAEGCSWSGTPISGIGPIKFGWLAALSNVTDRAAVIRRFERSLEV
ncbi:hypothetical protein [Paenibacillus thermotolerans]|uniref:hypothetical protein n=1 Tax=Paenibacillus thermotolerans TaxID=3027807 RepID=UPI0023681631|nr:MULTISPECIES: hypothetical protein [unclassified Paenibacillus]